MNADPLSYIVNWILIVVCIIGTGGNAVLLRWPEVIFYAIMGAALTINLINQNKSTE